MANERVLSGMRVTGSMHLGNFIGAAQNFVKYQQPGNISLYFMADLHALTTLEDCDRIQKDMIELIKDYLAAGLDPEKSIIYAQSSVPEISELCLYLSMVQPMGELQRIPTFKEKVRHNPDNVNLGLLSYPVLMAADILGPQATLVPVGEDQIPNVELARTIARKFNARFGETFTVPEMMSEMIKVKGLIGGKMSKSEPEGSIDINAPIAEIRERYLKFGVTDTERRKRSDPGDPYNRCVSVYPVHDLITLGERETRKLANACLAAEIGCIDCKNILVDSIRDLLEPFQAARAELVDKDEYIKEVIHEGGKKARAIIRETVEVVRDKMGIVIH